MNNFTQKIFFLFCIIISQIDRVKPQDIKDSVVQYLIRGKIASVANSSLLSQAYGLLSDTLFSIPVDAKGNFTVSVNYPFLKRVDLIINDTVYFFDILNRDTINLIADKSGIKVSVTDKKRTIKLNTEIKNYNKWNSISTYYITELLSKNNHLNKQQIADSINKYYNSQVADLLSANPEPDITGEIVLEMYYHYLWFFFLDGLFPKYGLTTVIPYSYRFKDSIAIPKDNNYRNIDTSLFYRSFEYRKFVDQYCNNAYFSLFSNAAGTTNFNESYGERDYYRLYYLIEHASIRDWLLFNLLKNLLKERRFSDFNSTFPHFVANSRHLIYNQYLQKYYDEIKRLAIGSDAPEFTLAGIDGKKISLSDFKGKVVYINFWGVNCGPCIASIQKYYPSIQARYKDVIYLNICVDSDERSWKKKVNMLNFKGVNVLAEGWQNNPVCKLYDIHAIPAYYIIDRKGKIAKTSSPAGIVQLLEQFPQYDFFKDD